MNIDRKTSDTTELIKLFSKIEELRMGYEDVLAFVYEGVTYMCNAHANSWWKTRNIGRFLKSERRSGNRNKLPGLKHSYTPTT